MRTLLACSVGFAAWQLSNSVSSHTAHAQFNPEPCDDCFHLAGGCFQLREIECMTTCGWCLPESWDHEPSECFSYGEEAFLCSSIECTLNADSGGFYWECPCAMQLESSGIH